MHLGVNYCGNEFIIVIIECRKLVFVQFESDTQAADSVNVDSCGGYVPTFQFLNIPFDGFTVVKSFWREE